MSGLGRLQTVEHQDYRDQLPASWEWSPGGEVEAAQLAEEIESLTGAEDPLRDTADRR